MADPTPVSWRRFTRWDWEARSSHRGGIIKVELHVLNCSEDYLDEAHLHSNRSPYGWRGLAGDAAGGAVAALIGAPQSVANARCGGSTRLSILLHLEKPAAMPGLVARLRIRAIEPREADS